MNDLIRHMKSIEDTVQVLERDLVDISFSLSDVSGKLDLTDMVHRELNGQMLKTMNNIVRLRDNLVAERAKLESELRAFEDDAPSAGSYDWLAKEFGFSKSTP